MKDITKQAIIEAGGTGREQVDFVLRHSNEEDFRQQAPLHLNDADQVWALGIVAGQDDPADLSVNYAVHGDGMPNSRHLRSRARSEYRQGQKFFSSAFDEMIHGKREDKMWRGFEIDILKNAAIRLSEFEGRFLGGYIVSHVRETDRIMGGVGISRVLRDTFLNGMRTSGFQTPEEQRELATEEQIKEMHEFSIDTHEQLLNASFMIGGTVTRWLPERNGLRQVFNRRKMDDEWHSGNIW
ncbi:MAG TPA: hypothetical protein VFK11_02255 [Candidatus Saccharimonadales bacterium]|nr:hypothetical protein [Candidatus Saccharimonadales bacterium]